MSDEHDELALDPGELAVQAQFLAEWRAGQRPRQHCHATSCSGWQKAPFAQASPGSAVDPAGFSPPRCASFPLAEMLILIPQFTV